MSYVDGVSTSTLASRIPYVEGAPPPNPPPGYVYEYHEGFPNAAILLSIFCFPIGKQDSGTNDDVEFIGLLSLLCMKEKCWRLEPIDHNASSV